LDHWSYKGKKVSARLVRRNKQTESVNAGESGKKERGDHTRLESGLRQKIKGVKPSPARQGLREKVSRISGKKKKRLF